MSAATTPATRPGPTRRRRAVYWIGGFLLLGAVLLAGYYFYAQWASDRQLAEIYAEIDASDPDWRWPDLLASRKPVPDAENSMLQVVAVSTMLKKTPFTLPGKWDSERDRTMRVRNARLSHESAELLRSGFQPLDPKIVIEARKLKSMPAGRLAIDPDMNPMDVMLHEVQEARALARLLESDAFLLAHDGKLDEALQSCQAIVNAARGAGDTPLLVAQLVRIALQAIAVGAIERTLGQGEVSPDTLEKLQTALEREADDNPLLQGLRGERAVSHQFYLHLREGKTTFTGMSAKLKTTPRLADRVFDAFSGVLLSGFPEHLRLANEQVEASKLNEVDRVEANNKIDLKVRGTSNFLVRQFMPAVSKASEADQRSRAFLRTTIAGLAAERYRLKHEHWPQDLPVLVKEGLLKTLPIDPYDGKPLRFKRTATGIVIYSVGIDKVDNGGKFDPNPFLPGVDIVFQLWDAPRRGAPPAIEAEAK